MGSPIFSRLKEVIKSLKNESDQVKIDVEKSSIEAEILPEKIKAVFDDGENNFELDLEYDETTQEYQPIAPVEAAEADDSSVNQDEQKAESTTAEADSDSQNPSEIINNENDNSMSEEMLKKIMSEVVSELSSSLNSRLDKMESQLSEMQAMKSMHEGETTVPDLVDTVDTDSSKVEAKTGDSMTDAMPPMPEEKTETSLETSNSESAPQSLKTEEIPAEGVSDDETEEKAEEEKPTEETEVAAGNYKQSSLKVNLSDLLMSRY
jgi:hypothetical protein